MPCSIGASARPMMMEPAIIMPGVRSPASTRYAPVPSMPTCTEKRNAFVAESRTLRRPEAADWNDAERRCRPCHRPIRPSNMPMAFSASELRIEDSRS